MPGPPPTSSNRPHVPLCALRGAPRQRALQILAHEPPQRRRELRPERFGQLEPRELELAAVVDGRAEEQAPA